MTTEPDIRLTVGRYLSGEIDLRTLRERLTPIKWDRENPPNDEAMTILRPMERYFAEFSNGDWTETEMRDLLAPYGGFVSNWEPEPLQGPGLRLESNPTTSVTLQTLVGTR